MHVGLILTERGGGGAELGMKASESTDNGID